MNQGVALLALLSLIFVASTFAYPSLSQTFTAKVSLVVVSHHGYGNDTGNGIWAVDEKAQSSVENYAFSKGIFDSLALNRYDLGKLYRVYATDRSRCDIVPVDDPMPNVWSWLADAANVGQRVFQGKQVDVWELNVGYGTRSLAVWSTNTSVPAWSYFQGGERDTYIEFTTYSATSPEASVFAVPSVCQNPSSRPGASEACISSATVIANANIWLDHHVPYDQEGRYLDYREDCSGYVSFCWKSGAPGLDTMEFHTVSHPISKAELVPGDCMLNAAEHVCLFGGWTDSDKTHYWAYEETQPCSVNPKWCGTMKNNIAYPYYYDPSLFLPYRYNNFCG